MTKRKNSIVVRALALTLTLFICFSLVFIYAVENEEIETLEVPAEESTGKESTEEPVTTPGEGESSDDSTDEPVVDPVEMTGIRFPNSSYDMTVGETLGLTIRLVPDGAEIPEEIFPWNTLFASDNEAVATVSEEGVVTAVAVGEAKITATIEGTDYTCECTIRVTNASAAMDLTFTTLENTGERIVTGFRLGATINEAIAAVKTAINANEVTIAKGDGSSISGSANIATGCIVTADGAEYTVVIRGDVNSDGRITTDDVTHLVQFLVGEGELTAAEMLAANVRGSTTITIENAYVIQRHIYGFEADRIVQ